LTASVSAGIFSLTPGTRLRSNTCYFFYSKKFDLILQADQILKVRSCLRWFR